MGKIKIDVLALYTKEGLIRPVKIIWRDKRVIEIDKVLDIRKAASLKAGGYGLRYECRILGKTKYLWFDNSENIWFVEGQ